MLTVHPLTETDLYEVDDSDDLCHIVADDGGWLCGGKPPPGPGGDAGRTHITRRPDDPICDGSRLPRCQKCEAIWRRDDRKAA